MKKDFKTWLTQEYGLEESAAASRVANLLRIEKFYGDVDALVKNGSIQRLLDDLTYTMDDERNNRPTKHRIPISGNLRTGSSTLKQALNRYLDFRGDTEINKAGLKDILIQLKDKLGKFKPVKRQSSYKSKEVKDLIQKPLLDYLRENLPNVRWDMEVKLTDKVKDSIDIMGVVNEDSLIIIEIDTVRSDQISKKFVSRQALTDDKNTIYVVLTYPNTNCMADAEKKAVKKYINYLITLTQLMAEGSNLEKYLIIENL